MSDEQRKPLTTPYEEQERQGLIRNNAYRNYVPPAAKSSLSARRLPTELNQVTHTIDVMPSATHHVEMKTSAVDRSKGFLIATVPLFGAFALGVVLVSVFFWAVPFFSLVALVVFWLSFVGAWMVAYLYTLLVSAEGIAFFEAWRKWRVVDREQTERWNYYKGIRNDRTD